MLSDPEVKAAAKKVEDALEAYNALIARRLGEGMNRIEEPESPASIEFIAAMRLNRHKLKGRMSAQQVSEAIGIPIDHSSRLAFGMAVKAIGAKKGKSGSTRYYVF